VNQLTAAFACESVPGAFAFRRKNYATTLAAGLLQAPAIMPPCLLAALPPLPEELGYRFLAGDLVLVDLHARLIVDFIPRALRGTT
jgi:hypothetical protein